MSRALALALLLLARVTHASPEQDAADRLIEEGVELAEEGAYAEACARFTAALELRPGVRAQGLEAGCYEKLGRLATAWRSFARLRQLADDAGDAESAAFAAAGLARLRGRLARLTLTVRGDLDAVVSVDGAVWPRSSWGRPIPVDAGSHVVRVERPGQPTHQERVQLSDGDSVHRWIDPPPAPPLPRASGPSLRRTLGLSALGAGAITMVIGGVVGLGATRTWDDAKAAGCSDSGRCPDARSLALAERAGDRADVATRLFASGLVFAGAGAVLWLTDRHRAAERPRLSVGPTASGAAAGLGVDGWF